MTASDAADRTLRADLVGRSETASETRRRGGAS